MALVLPPWQPPPLKPVLDEHVVHLWRFPLADDPCLETLLDEHELQRAGRLRVPGKARAFIIARARLRQILAAYVGLEPQALSFEYGAHGKPALAGKAAGLPAFNLAHSGAWGLCAVTGEPAVGVDVEQLDRPLDFERLARGYLSPGELAWLHTCPEHRRRRLFFRIWTRKEAWLKCKGGGFSDPDQDTSLLSGATSDSRWWLKNFPLARGCLAAVAIPRQPVLLQRWHLG